MSDNIKLNRRKAVLKLSGRALINSSTLLTLIGSWKQVLSPGTFLVALFYGVCVLSCSGRGEEGSAILTSV